MAAGYPIRICVGRDGLSKQQYETGNEGDAKRRPRRGPARSAGKREGDAERSGASAEILMEGGAKRRPTQGSPRGARADALVII